MMLRIDTETRADAPRREALLDAAFGPERFAKTCERFREGRLPAEGLALTAKLGDELVGTIRFWPLVAGDRPALMLGPVAVSDAHRSLGIGGKLIRRGLTIAGAQGHRAVLLVGDAPYYARFGFERRLAAGLDLPGPYDPARFLGLELQPSALAGAQGMVSAAGRLDPARRFQAAAERAIAGETEGDRA